MTPPKNIAASVRKRLLNRAKSRRRPFNELLQYYAMERFLYRLSQSVHVDRFIESKQAQWAAFRKRLGQEQVPISFREIAVSVDSFLSPIAAGFSPGKKIPTNWAAPGPWA